MVAMSGITVDTLKREFVDGKTNQILPDINPVYTPEEVRDYLSTQYPHLLNAEIEGPEVLKSKLKYKFVTRAGTKG